MTKFLDKKMTFAMPRKKVAEFKKCPHAEKVFGRILKKGKWYALPCMCKLEREK